MYPINAHGNQIKATQLFLLPTVETLQEWRSFRRRAKMVDVVTAFLDVCKSANLLFLSLARERIAPMLRNVISATRESFSSQREVRYQVASRTKIGNTAATANHTITRMNPVRARQFKSDVMIPLGNAVIAGAFASSGGILIGIAIDQYFFSLMTSDVIFFSGVFGFAVAAKFWFKRAPHLDDAIYTIEEMTGRDINQDGVIGNDDAYIAPRSIPYNTARGESKIEASNPLQKIHIKKWKRLAYLHLHLGVKFSRREIVKASKQQEGDALSVGDYAKMYEALSNAKMMKRNKLNDDGKRWLASLLPDRVNIK